MKKQEIKCLEVVITMTNKYGKNSITSSVIMFLKYEKCIFFYK